MSNLGTYQKMTTFAKKVGGPKILGILLVGGGYVTLRIVEAGIKKIIKVTKREGNKSVIDTKTIFSVTSDGKESGGLELCAGDKYRVLEVDGKSVLIEKLGDSNNPYFVSADFLYSISDYK